MIVEKLYTTKIYAKRITVRRKNKISNKLVKSVGTEVN